MAVVINGNGAVTGLTALPDSAMAVGSILQVVQTVKTDVASITVGNGVISDLTTAGVGQMAPVLTCSSSTNKVLIIASITVGINNTGEYNITLTVDGSVTTFRGDADNNRQRISACQRTGNSTNMTTITAHFLYSPGDTSQHTYGVAVSHGNDINQTIQINQGVGSSDQTYTATAASSLTLLEVSA